MRPELLAPAGSLAKLKCALNFGADAVYAGGKAFSLRAFADNFTEEELAEGIAYAHERGKKVYVAANIFVRNADLAPLAESFRSLERMGADAVLVSDLGALALCRRVAPALAVHISTQANVTNAEAARAYRALGASRVVLARELSFAEIAAIHAACPDLELEAFVHGAMCISYSGRCYLSDYLDDRPANRGACVQACRRAYRIQSKGQSGWCDLEEDGRGTYVMNSRDLNLSAHLDELAAAGVCSFKIEGRMKSEYYLATVVNAYRRILDGAPAAALADELETCDHRAYTTAFALGKITIRCFPTARRRRERVPSSPLFCSGKTATSAWKCATAFARARCSRCFRRALRSAAVSRWKICATRRARPARMQSSCRGAIRSPAPFRSRRGTFCAAAGCGSKKHCQKRAKRV